MSPTRLPAAQVDPRDVVMPAIDLPRVRPHSPLDDKTVHPYCTHLHPHVPLLGAVLHVDRVTWLEQFDTMNGNPNFEQQSELTDLHTILPHSEPPICHGSTKETYTVEQDRHTAVVEKIGECAVGFGGHSDVWKAKLTRRNGITSLVALKVLRPVGSDHYLSRKRLEREVRYWQPLDHQNIAPFYGASVQSNGSPAIVLPWYKNGSANAYLQNRSGVNPMQIIHDIACGIEYLHGNGIVHGDIKGVNIMIDDRGHARLIDFGLARHVDTQDNISSTISSIRWCAPELPSPSDTHPTKASDVYAFASTVLELLTGAVPYVKLPTTAVYWMVINGVDPRKHSNGLRYCISRPDLLWRLLEQCWSEAAGRPTISEVKKALYMFGASFYFISPLPT